MRDEMQLRSVIGTNCIQFQNECLYDLLGCVTCHVAQRTRLGEGWVFCVTSASACVLLLISDMLFSQYSYSPIFVEPTVTGILFSDVIPFNTQTQSTIMVEVNEAAI